MENFDDIGTDAQPPSYGTPQKLLDNLIQIESSGNPLATNQQSGAQGLAQFMPSTVKMLNDKGYNFNPYNATEARIAMDHYLSDLNQRNGGDWRKTVAQYGGFKTKDPTAYVNRALSGVNLPQNQPVPNNQPVPQNPNQPNLDSISPIGTPPGQVSTTTNPILMGTRDVLGGSILNSLKWMAKIGNAVSPDSNFTKQVNQGVVDMQNTMAAQEAAYQAVPHTPAGQIARAATNVVGTAALSPGVKGAGVVGSVLQGASSAALTNPDNPAAAAGIGAATGGVLGGISAAAGKISGGVKQMIQDVAASKGIVIPDAQLPQFMKNFETLPGGINKSSISNVFDQVINAHGGDVVTAAAQNGWQLTKNIVRAGLDAAKQAVTRGTTGGLIGAGLSAAIDTATGKPVDVPAMIKDAAMGVVGGAVTAGKTAALKAALSAAGTGRIIRSAAGGLSSFVTRTPPAISKGLTSLMPAPAENFDDVGTDAQPPAQSK